jgi:hypothetical protein
LNRAAGDEKGSSFRFLADEGEEGIFLRVFVDSPRIRFWGTRAGAMVKKGSWSWELFECKQVESRTYVLYCIVLANWRDQNCGWVLRSRHIAARRGRDVTLKVYRGAQISHVLYNVLAD